MKKNYTAAALKHLISSLRPIMFYRCSPLELARSSRSWYRTLLALLTEFVSDILVLELSVTTERPQQMKSPFTVSRLRWNIPRQEDPLFTAQLLLINIKLANPPFGKIVCCRVTLSVLVHDMRVLTPSLVRFTEHFLERDTHSSRDFHTPVVESSWGPPSLAISGGLGKRLNEGGRALGGGGSWLTPSNDHPVLNSYRKSVSYLLC